MKVRKKPVEVEARQLGKNYDDDVETMRWCNGQPISAEDGMQAMFAIETLEGRMVASTGDWIIRGVNGEFYPCKPDVFDKTYEAVE